VATLSELRTRVRLKCDDNEATKVFDDSFYDDEINAAVKAHNSDLTVTTLAGIEEHLIVWLASAQVCLGRAAKQTSGSSYPTQDAGNIDDVSLEGLSAKKFDPLKSVDHWFKLASEYQGLYDVTQGGTGLAEIDQSYLRRYDRESQLQLPNNAYKHPVAVTVSAEVLNATSVRLTWTVSPDRDFLWYKVYYLAGGTITDETGTLARTESKQSTLSYDVTGLTAAEHAFAIYTWNTTSTSLNRSFGVSNTVTATPA
tara:strand:- start:1441 stop:2205 length:765 start_codon:yes stop_codon:yes gene_type:complete